MEGAGRSVGPEYRTVRVFISSTFKDMQAERDHLVRFVFPRLREELLGRRIQLVDVDLRWGVTGDQDALEACLETIDECRPRFLCMLGGRYGWVPPGKTRSITAEEVHYGVLDRDLLGRGSAFFYFRDPAATAAMVEAQAGEFREPAGSAGERALEELKGSIASAGLDPFVYPAQWDRDAQRLVGLTAFGDRVYEDLLKSIDEEFGAAPPEAPDEFGKEAAAMDAFIAERSDGYVGGSRDAVVEQLLRHVLGSTENGYLCLSGAPGSGKSALLAAFSQDPGLRIQPECVLVTHFAGASMGAADVVRVLRRLCHELSAWAGLEAELPEEPETLRAFFARLLGQVCERQHTVLIIDGVDELERGPFSSRFSWLPDELPINARVVLSAAPGPVLDDLRRRSQPPLDVELPPLTRADGEAIIARFLRRYRKAMTGEQRAALLAKADAATPLYLRTALEELRTLGPYEEITTRVTLLPPGIRGLFAWILARLAEDEGFRDARGRRVGQELVPQFAALLGVSRHGLSEPELAQLLALGDACPGGDGQDDAQGNVAALLRLLRPLLVRRGELLDFGHSEFRAAARDTYLATKAARLAAHKRLGFYFSGQAHAVGDGTWTGPLPRGFSELLFHLEKAGMWTEIAGCLRDPRIFAHVPAGAYGLDYEGGTYVGGDPDALLPGALAGLPAVQRSAVGSKLASVFADQAWARIKHTRDFATPWPQTAQYLREHNLAGFFDYRDTFYSFIRLAGKAAEYAVVAFEDSEAGRNRLAAFREANGGIHSFLNYLGNFGHGETGLSHAIEDDAYPSQNAWEELDRLT